MRYAVALLLLLVPAVAYGQSAEEHYQRGQAAYDAGDYPSAVRHWQRAVEATADPAVRAGLFYNLGQAQRRSGDCVEALASYRASLRLDASSPKAPMARQFVRELALQCEPKPPPRRVEIAEPVRRDDPPRSGRTKRIAGVATAGGGALLLLTGAYYGNRARTLADDVATACALGCDWPDVADADAEGRRAEKRQWIFLGLGTAAVATGGVLYYLGVRDRRAHSVAVVPAGSDGIGVAWSGVW